MSKTEINDYLSKCDEDLANNVIYRVYGMPGPIFMENNDTSTPEPGPEPPTPPTPSYTTPFYVENITDEDETLTFTCYLDDLPITIETSTDASNWDTLGTIGEGDPYELTAQLRPNNKLYVRATTNTWCNSVDGEGIPVGCTISGISKVGGNIMSLLYGSNFTGEETTLPSNSTHNFAGLFYSNYELISASELILPATTLTNSCYMHMFANCTSLTTAPELPATTLASGCYDGMFSNCTPLTTAPTILPAITLADYCYYKMFYNCTSLTTAPNLPATTLAESCYLSMFQGCTSLTTTPELPVMTLTGSCYSSMFADCTSLTTAPELPATTLVEWCYNSMFSGCTSLTTAPTILPAITLADYCYYNMFYGCTNINYIKCLATDISATDCTYNWLSGVAATGTFVKNPSMSGWISGNNVPSGWTVQDATN